MCSAHGNITCGVSPYVKDQVHKCKEMGGKRQTPHGQPGGRQGVPLGRGVLENACWGGAEENMEPLGSAAIWDRDGNKYVGVGAVLHGAEESKMGGAEGFLGQHAIRCSLEAVQG